jgi:hypothetical protein
MKRSEFLRTAILAAIATPVLLPKILEDQPEAVSIYPQLDGRIDFTMKVNDAILQDPQAFNRAINGLVIDRNVKSIDIGLMDDDFAMGLKTVNITFV